jgi:hypothetical protein
LHKCALLVQFEPNSILMTPEKKRRIATAGMFLSGVVGCLDALRDANFFWPPDEVWKVLRNPNRLKLGAGIALIVVSLVTWTLRRRAASER